MSGKGYDVTLSLKGKDDLTRVFKRPTTAMDLLADSADPRAKRSFRSFSLSAVAGLKLVYSGAKLVGRGLRGIGRLASTVFHKIARGAKIAALAGGVLAGVLLNWGADIVEDENLFTVSMGSMVAEAEAWSAGISKSLRMNENDIKKYLATFNVMLDSMGLAPDKAFEVSKGLTQLAFDMASFYNLKPEGAFEKLQAGISGEVEPLKRLGILLNETTVKAYAMANGIGAAGGKLTETEKIIARYGALMQMTEKAQGDMGRTLESISNRMKQIWAGGIAFGQKIGKGIVESKIVGDVFTWISDQFTALSESVDAAAITEKLDEWTDAAHKFFTEVAGVGGLWKDIKAGWTEMLESVVIGTEEKTKTVRVSGMRIEGKKILPSKWEKQTTTVTKTLADVSWTDPWEYFGETTLPMIKDAIRDVGKGIIKAFKYISSGQAREDWSTLKTDLKAFKEGANQALEPIGKVLTEIWRWTKANPELVGTIVLVMGALSVLGPPLLTVATAIATVAIAITAVARAISGLALLAKLVSAVATAIGGLSVATLVTIGAVVLAIGAVIFAFVQIRKEWTNVKKLFRDGWFLIQDLFRAGSEAISGFFGKLWEDIQTDFQTAMRFIRNSWDQLMTAWSARWETAKEGVRVGIDLVKEYFRGLGLDAKRHWSNFTGWLRKTWDALVTWMGGKADWLKDKLNPFKRFSPSMVDNWRAGMAAMRADFMGLHSYINANPVRFQPQYAGAVASVAGGGGYARSGGHTSTTTRHEYNVTVGARGRGQAHSDNLRLARDIANETKRKER